MRTIEEALTNFLSNDNNLCGMSSELALQTIQLAGGTSLFLVGARRPTAFEQHQNTLFKATTTDIIDYLNANKPDLLKFIANKENNQFNGSIVAYIHHHVSKQKAVTMKYVADGLYNNLTLSQIIYGDDFSLEDCVSVIGKFIYELAVKHVFDCYVAYLEEHGSPNEYNNHPFGEGSNLYNKDHLLDDVFERMGGSYGIGLLSQQCLDIKCKDICTSFKNTDEVVDFFERHKEDIVDVIKTVGAKDGMNSAVKTIQHYAAELGLEKEDIGRGIYSSFNAKSPPNRLKSRIAKAAVNLIFIAAARDYLDGQRAETI